MTYQLKKYYQLFHYLIQFKLMEEISTYLLNKMIWNELIAILLAATYRFTRPLALNKGIASGHTFSRETTKQ